MSEMNIADEEGNVDIITDADREGAAVFCFKRLLAVYRS